MNRTTCHVLVCAIVAVVWASAAHAQPGFTEADLTGGYVFAFDGFDKTTPVASVGGFQSDGAGRFRRGNRTLVVGGNPIPQKFRCTYTVSGGGGDATCDITTLFPTEEYVETWKFVIVNGDEIHFTVTSGMTIRGLARRQ